MEESRELKAMRYVAWAKAKGELFGMLATHEVGNNVRCYSLEKVIHDFIEKIENEGLYK